MRTSGRSGVPTWLTSVKSSLDKLTSESRHYEHAVRKAVSLGGDADTRACIAGGIAEAYYRGVPEPIRKKTFEILDERLAVIAAEFVERFMAAI